jgi:chaperonin GroEL
MYSHYRVSELNNPNILITDVDIDNIERLVPVLEKASKKNNHLLIFANKVEGTALMTLAQNTAMGTFTTAIVSAPAEQILEEIAEATGGKFISKKSGFDLRDLELEDLGTCEKAYITDHTLLVGTGSKLSKKVGVLKVGASTEQEKNYLYYKLQDAVNAARTAQEDGVVQGRGTPLALVHIPEQTDGDRVLNRAITKPLRQIMENADLDPGTILFKVEDTGKGYDVLADKHSDLVKDGIVDPAKAIKVALKNAVSTAGAFLTTEVAVVEHVKSE